MAAKVHPIARMSSHGEATGLPSNGEGVSQPKPFVFRKLFGLNQLNNQSSELSDLTAATTSMYSRRMSSSSALDTSLNSSINSKIMRRKSAMDGFSMLQSSANIPLSTTDEEVPVLEESEAIELSLLNQVSSTLSELKRGDEEAWKELTTLTTRIFSQISHQDSHEELKSIIIEHGFTTKHGWRSHDVDVNGLLQAFSNIYITMQNRHAQHHDAHNKIKNIQALTFCPNVLFANFPHEFKPEPVSISFQSAVLLADISGFSKFAGEMCLRGAKGLDVLHKVTSDFLGHFVHTVYDFDGDGRSQQNYILKC